MITLVFTLGVAFVLANLIWFFVLYRRHRDRYSCRSRYVLIDFVMFLCSLGFCGVYRLVSYGLYCFIQYISYPSRALRSLFWFLIGVLLGALLISLGFYF